MKFLVGFLAGVAGNALFWFVNESIQMLSGPSQWVAMGLIFIVLFLAAYSLSRGIESRTKRVMLASHQNTDGAMNLDASGSRVRGDDVTIASGNTSGGDMTIKATDLDIG